MARPGFVMRWADADTAAALRARYRREHQPDRRLRLHGLWLLRTGASVAQTAATLAVHRRTVDRWVAAYRAGGLTQVLACRRGGPGRPRWLTTEQEAQLRTEVATGRFGSATEIGAWIGTAFGVHFHPGGVSTVLRRLQARPKVPRPRHVKTDLAAQAAWQKGG